MLPYQSVLWPGRGAGCNSAFNLSRVGGMCGPGLGGQSKRHPMFANHFRWMKWRVEPDNFQTIAKLTQRLTLMPGDQPDWILPASD